MWPLHPIRLRLIGLFFRLEERDEERHWALCNPAPPLPPLLHKATHPPAVALSVALEELWLSAKKKKEKRKKKPALTTHFSMMCTHTHTHSSWHKDWKNQLPQSAPLVRLEMPLELSFDHEGTLKLALVTHTVEFFKVMIACRAGTRLHWKFYRFWEKFSHTTVEWCLCSYKNNHNTVLGWVVEFDQIIIRPLKWLCLSEINKNKTVWRQPCQKMWYNKNFIGSEYWNSPLLLFSTRTSQHKKILLVFLFHIINYSLIDTLAVLNLTEFWGKIGFILSLHNTQRPFPSLYNQMQSNTTGHISICLLVVMCWTALYSEVFKFLLGSLTYTWKAEY